MIDNHVNYGMKKELERVVDAGVIGEIGNDSEIEDRHIAELIQRISALDDKEVYVVTKSLVKYHRHMFIKTLDLMEGEQNGADHQ